MADLSTKAEQAALKATSYEEFAVNLSDIKRSVTAVLSQFGRHGIFDQYTMHDVSHIDDMLTTLDWLIPSQTASILTSADWLMLVMSIYFHDMGLVVTKDEFEGRENTGFAAFCRDILFAPPNGDDYRAKVDALEPDSRERFLYQEFVRYNHGKRVRAWIEGSGNKLLGNADAQMQEIDRMLAPLDKTFRRDLAIVCESHSLDDLDNISRYKVSQPYGNSDDQTVNVQYCALILRTVDLVQITRRRTPAILFRLINPADPVSQAEWAKQDAVRRVRAKAGVDRDGNASHTVQSDTVEVFARFNNENGYFGLTSYLRYARSQIQRSFEVAQRAKKHNPKDYSFPWRFLDDTNVEVEGFEKRPFEFEIDQEKILDLLTGHTLYNDSAVVVRELVQNAIDAVRLKANAWTSAAYHGKVTVRWSSSLSVLEIIDNGTGMTQEIIENHLLKVGSSRYQDQKFREANPDFSPISRFGIGVLSSFMVADNVEILTVSPEEEQARQISLRSVHGKYLIKLLDKHTDSKVRQIGPHGTSFKLTFRPSAQKADVLATVRRWILFPRCHVQVEIDGGTAVDVGYASPREAIQAFLDLNPKPNSTRSEVREKTIRGVTVAYAVEYNSHYKEWNFMSSPERARRPDERQPAIVPVGTCVEGIAVEFESPGFGGQSIFAVANAIGKSAPKTNVARSALESTSERDDLFASVYEILFQAACDESERLRSVEGYSLTWSVEQLPVLLYPLLAAGPRNRKSHIESLRKVPMFIVENDDQRSRTSLTELHQVAEFWTVESQLNRSVEYFIREARAEVTARGLLKVSQGTSSSLPTGAIIANSDRSELIRTRLQQEFDVVEIRGQLTDRRLDMRWLAESKRWISREVQRQVIIEAGLYDRYQQFSTTIERNGRGYTRAVFSPIYDVVSSGLDDYFSVLAFSSIYILPNTAFSREIRRMYESDMSHVEKAKSILYFMDAVEFLSSINNGLAAPSLIDHFNRQAESLLPADWVGVKNQLVSASAEDAGRLSTFNPQSWSLRNPFAMQGSYLG